MSRSTDTMMRAAFLVGLGAAGWWWWRKSSGAAGSSSSMLPLAPRGAVAIDSPAPPAPGQPLTLAPVNFGPITRPDELRLADERRRERLAAGA